MKSVIFYLSQSKIEVASKFPPRGGSHPRYAGRRQAVRTLPPPPPPPNFSNKINNFGNFLVNELA